MMALIERTLCSGRAKYSMCYFNPDYVMKIAEEAIEINRNISINNTAKIFYSLAISLIVMKQYDDADTYIKSCIETNKNSNYLAGCLFGLIAQSYKEFAINGIVNKNLIKEIKNTIAIIKGVYEYLLLPIYIMNNETENIIEFKSKYIWLDFDKTTANINNFISKLKN